MQPRTYRIIYIALATALALTVVGTILLVDRQGEAPELPTPLEAITPGPNEQVLRQAFLQIDLPIGYEIELTVDNFVIPTEEIGYVAGTGVFTWSPGVDRTFLEWTPGPHEVSVRWKTVVGLPDPGEFSWTFRTY
ncbi:MAG TPA: hypothetical protein ENH15_00260 [Actinobacteria bacterium]|nr:hypothetical protein [Actinomycetota bacterium]